VLSTFRARDAVVLSPEHKEKASRFISNPLRHQISGMHLECCIIDESRNTWTQSRIYVRRDVGIGTGTHTRSLLRETTSVSFLDWAITLMARSGGQKQTRIIPKQRASDSPWANFKLQTLI
jgi:hypothetical protein